MRTVFCLISISRSRVLHVEEGAAHQAFNGHNFHPEIATVDSSILSTTARQLIASMLVGFWLLTVLQRLFEDFMHS